jgi:predicted ATPase
MLQSIRLKDFKSFVDEEVTLAPLTVLVGANGSGKSNLLDAIRFVQGLGLGFSLLDVLQGRWEAGREVWRGLRGGVAETVHHGRSSARLLTTWRLESHPWAHHVEFSLKPKPELVEEWFKNLNSQTGEWWGGAPSRFSDEQLEAKADEFRSPWEYATPFDRSMLSLPIKFGAGESPPDFAPGLKAQEQILSLLKSSLLLHLLPERMRGYSPKQAGQLGAEGEHLSSMLWSLCQDEQVRQEWVDWLSELLAPELSGIDFIETELGDVMLTLVEEEGTRTSARSLSDGTLRFLGMLVALRTAPAGSIVLMEEPESGLHPQRVHLLVEYMEAVTKERGIQVITTTHSPQLLQSLSPEGLRNTVLCARVPDRPGTVLRRLGDLPHFDEVSTRSRIDHLFTTGWLERAL